MRRSTRNAGRRLGIFSDSPLTLVKGPDGPRVAPEPADFPFLTFASAVGGYFESALLFGRVGRTPASPELLLPLGVALRGLPSYDGLLQLDQVVRAIPGTLRGFWRGLSDVDILWVFGPHPFAFLLVGLSLVRRKRVVLGVRQDTVAYFRMRLPGARWKPVLMAVHMWDAGFRVLARILRLTVVGDDLARRYGRENEKLLAMTVSLIRDEDVVADVPQRDWNGTIDLLTVGRIDQEKNPMLLMEAMAALEQACPGRYRLAWAGTGPLAHYVRQRALELGISDQVEFLGFVPFGPGLLERYRAAHVFVHVSLTEGVPAVLIEALASGTPVVATDVGGVASALDAGRAGLLVPPADKDALVDALRRVADDTNLREHLVRHGLELARERTLNVQAARVAQFISGTL